MREVLGLDLAQPLVIRGDIGRGIEEQRIRLDIRGRAEPRQQILAQREEAAEVGEYAVPLSRVLYRRE
jgi:hypothetical protein